MDRKKGILLVIILLVSAFLRFYNLMHDAPYFFDPDERNMANAIAQFKIPAKLLDIPNCIITQFVPITNPQPTTHNPQPNCNLNPHFFAYGQFPLYLAFLSDQIYNLPINLIGKISPIQPITHNSQLTTNFPSSIFWLRFWSAVSSVLTVLFVYLITKELFRALTPQLPITNYQLSIIAALIAAFSPGLIQSAHFGTTESLLTFFFLSSVYVSLSYLSYLGHLRFVILASLTIGLALGSKLTGSFFLIPPFISLTVKIIKLFSQRISRKKKVSGLLGYWLIGLLVLIGSILIFILSSLYNMVDPADFKSAVFGYESDVAMGRYEAFYTRQFVNTAPIIFQAEKIFPFALGWPVFTLGTAGFLFMFVSLISKLIQTIVQSIRYQVSGIRYKKERNKNIRNTYCLILTTSFLFFFLPNSFLFAKWTRFMTPILPFFSIFAGYLLFSFRRLHLRGGATSLGYLSYILVILSILPGLAFISVYTHEDSRVQASRWIYQNIPDKSYILSETANVIDIPLGLPTNNLQLITNNYTVISFDFYRIDENPDLGKEVLISQLEKADYIFIPSRRIFANYTRLPQKYPLVTKYYQLLFSGALGFEKVAEINSYPSIGPFKFPDENAEETFTVFDHPVIRIYKKIKPLDGSSYRALFATL